MYVGGSTWTSLLASAESATGINYNCVETFTDADPQWSDWVSPWVTTAWGFAQWLTASPNRTIIITQNLVPDSVANNESSITWEQACAAGNYNSYATQLAQNLVSTGFGSSVIRLGHEMNGNWYNDAINGYGDPADATSAEESAWAQCFAQEVTAMRAVSGAHFLFDWNVNACVGSIPLSSFYPGNAYVNIIGIDQYDASCEGIQPAPSASAFQALISAQGSLTSTADVIAFAKAQGKPISFPEWGLVSSSTGTGLGDDPYYVQGMAALIASNNVAYQSYFDAGDDSILPLGPDAPLATAAYIAAFS
jgi:hypothetical protein